MGLILAISRQFRVQQIRAYSYRRMRIERFAALEWV